MYIEDLELVAYDKLPSDAIMIRKLVFVEEQGFLKEFDEIDENDKTKHIVAYKDSVPIGTCRFYMKDGEYNIGRIAVVKEYRGKGVGAIIVEFAEEKIYEMGGTEISLSAQVRVKSFYEKIGYVCVGNIYLDEMCPHIRMRKSIVEGENDISYRF